VEILRKRLERRTQRFLAVAQNTIYPHPANPYRKLLHHVGCEYGDLEKLVNQEGVEGALRVLYRGGVYLTGDEYKGRRPVRRGSTSFIVNPADILNPRAVVHGLSMSSGSRGAPTLVPIDLGFIFDHAVNTHLALHVHGGKDWVHAHWGVPGGTAVTNPLEFAKGGNAPEQWFSPVHLGSPGLHPRYRWGSMAMRLGGLLAGVPLPRAVHVPLNDPYPIARWMVDVLEEGRVPHLWTFASSSVLVCQEASRAKLDLSGARFTAGGEPMTAARKAVIERVGGQALPRYGATETDIIAFACAEPDGPDDQHLFHDRHAVIQPGQDEKHNSLPPRALMMSSLLPTAPIILLNVCLGDQAELVSRECGCGLEELGWPTHIRMIRSFEKLTAGGITLLDTDVIRVLEEVLPEQFGGAPTNYQLVERLDTEDARPQVQLLVDPSVGPVDTEQVAEVFLTAIGGGSSGERLMELQWRGGGVLRVVREVPHKTASGKILHLHLQRESN
jgi:hypothetical protein